MTGLGWPLVACPRGELISHYVCLTNQSIYSLVLLNSQSLGEKECQKQDIPISGF